MDTGFADLLSVYELTVTCTFGTESFTAAIGALDESTELGDGGYASQSGQVMVVAASEFVGKTTPDNDDAVTVNGKALRVSGRITSPDGMFYVYSLYDPNRGV